MSILKRIRALWAIEVPFEGEELEPVDEEDAAYLRALSGRVADQMTQAQLDAQAESRTTARWLLATFVTLNAGAAVAVASSDRLAPEAVRFSIAAFTSGCVLGLLTGLAGVLAGMLLGGPLGATAEAYRFDAMTGRIRRTSFELIFKFRRLSVILAGMVGLIGLGALVAFAIGAYRLTVPHALLPIDAETAP